MGWRDEIKKYKKMMISEIFDIPQTPFQAVMQEVADTTSVFDSPGGRLHVRPVPGFEN